MLKELDMNIVNEVMGNLEKNNMKPYFCSTSAEALKLVESLLKKGETVATGGSATLGQTGILDLLRCGDYNFIDRAKASTPQEMEEVYLGAFRADTYLMSTNALIRSGVLYNVDGNSNRVAALLYGPKSVVVVCGFNKIVENVDEAVQRMKTIAAPLNTKRLNTGAYCEHAGECMSLSRENPALCDGCAGEGRICCNFVLSAQQRKKDRIKVIIVGEELGF